MNISIGKPSDKDQWDAICIENGNLQQSTFFDPVQAFYRQQPVYLEVWEGSLLLGGSKVFIYTPATLSKVTTPLAKYFLQAGESILKMGIEFNTILPFITEAYNVLLKKESPVWYSNYVYFNHPDRMINPSKWKRLEKHLFANAYIPLTKSVDDLWSAVHPHHQQKIKQAQKRGYKVSVSDDISVFLGLLASTYHVQKLTGPNPDFIKLFYKTMKPSGYINIYTCKKDELIVSAALVTTFGSVAYYAFGGNNRNNDGGSHLLHWELMKKFAETGFTKYYLGQVAVSEGSGDQKFKQGISPFKRRFGTTEVLGSRKTFIFKPNSYHLWKMISSLTGKR